MRLLLLISLLLITVSTFGQPPAPVATNIAGATPKPLANSVIRGRVVYDDNEMPVRRAKITLYPVPTVAKVDDEDTDAAAPPQATVDAVAFTDMNGSFVLKNVPAGSFYPDIEHKGILSLSEIRGDAVMRLTDNTTLSAFYESFTTDGLGEIHVQIRAKRSAAISGIVRYSDGEPAIGQEIELFRKTRYGFDSTGGGSKEKTDDRGAFRFAELPPGEYAVRASEQIAHSESTRPYQDTKSHLVTFFPNKSSLEDAELIILGIGTDRSDIDIALPTRNLFTLRGTIISRVTKEPVGDGRITLYNDDRSNGRRLYYDSGSVSFQLEKNGSWQFTDLPSGKYKVSFERDREETDPKVDPNSPPAPASKSIDVTIEDADRNDVVIEVVNESAIAGTIVMEGGKPVPYMVYASLFDEKTKAHKYVPIYDRERYSGEGKPKESTVMTFRIGDISAGSYALDFSSGQTHFVKSASGGGIDLTKSKLTIGEAKTISGIRVVLSDEVAKVRGVAMDASKNPLAGGFVTLVPVDMTQWETGSASNSFYVSATGTFNGSVAPGEYYIFARRIPDQGESEADDESITRIERWRKLIIGADKFTLKAGENPKMKLVEKVTPK